MRKAHRGTHAPWINAPSWSSPAASAINRRQRRRRPSSHRRPKAQGGGAGELSSSLSLSLLLFFSFSLFLSSSRRDAGVARKRRKLLPSTCQDRWRGTQLTDLSRSLLLCTCSSLFLSLSIPFREETIFFLPIPASLSLPAREIFFQNFLLFLLFPLLYARCLLFLSLHHILLHTRFLILLLDSVIIFFLLYPPPLPLLSSFTSVFATSAFRFRVEPSNKADSWTPTFGTAFRPDSLRFLFSLFKYGPRTLSIFLTFLPRVEKLTDLIFYHSLSPCLVPKILLQYTAKVKFYRMRRAHAAWELSTQMCVGPRRYSRNSFSRVLNHLIHFI